MKGCVHDPMHANSSTDKKFDKKQNEMYSRKLHDWIIGEREREALYCDKKVYHVYLLLLMSGCVTEIRKGSIYPLKRNEWHRFKSILSIKQKNRYVETSWVEYPWRENQIIIIMVLFISTKIWSIFIMLSFIISHTK